MRRSESALAYIVRIHHEKPLWLAQWNERWMRYHFVGGHREPDETFRECLIREVHEELMISTPEDFSLGTGPALRWEHEAESQRNQLWTHYKMEIFEVCLTAKACRHVSERRENRWLTEQQILNGQTSEGRQICNNMAGVLSLLLQGSSDDQPRSNRPAE